MNYLRICALLLTLNAVAQLPPAPIGFNSQPVPTPKAREQTVARKIVNGPAMVNLAPMSTTGALSIASITRSNNQTTLTWQGGTGPYMVQAGWLGIFSNAGPATMLRAKAITSTASRQLYRVQDSYPLFTTTRSNETVLTWDIPEIDMSDSFGPFHIDRSPNGVDSWVELLPAVAGTGPYTKVDPHVPSPTDYYRIRQQTTGGVIVPYNIARVGGNPGDLSWVNAAVVQGGQNNASIRGMAKDREGYIIAVGEFQGTVNFGDGAITSAGGSGFILKYSSGGSLVWSKQTDSGGLKLNGVAVNSANEIIVCGFFVWTVDLGNGVSLTSPVDPLGNNWGNILLAKYSNPASSKPVCQWGKSYGGDQQDSAYSVSLDSSDNIFIACMSNSANCAFDSITLHATFYDIVIAKVNNSGVAQDGKVWTGPSDFDRANGIAVDKDGNVFVTGVVGTGANVGGGAATDNGFFLSKYSGSNLSTCLWAKMFVSGNAQAVACDPVNGRVVFTGNSGSTKNFGGGNIGGGLFLVMYEPDGTHVASKSMTTVYGFSELDLGYAVGVDSSHRVYFSGQAATQCLVFGDPNRCNFGRGLGYFVAAYEPPVASFVGRWAVRMGESSTGQSISRALAIIGERVAIGGSFSGKDYFDNTVYREAPLGAQPSFAATYFP